MVFSITGLSAVRFRPKGNTLSSANTAIDNFFLQFFPMALLSITKLLSSARVLWEFEILPFALAVTLSTGGALNERLITVGFCITVGAGFELFLQSDYQIDE